MLQLHTLRICYPMSVMIVSLSHSCLMSKTRIYFVIFSVIMDLCYIVFFPSKVKLGVVGFSMGAAMALYSATCRVIGQYRNGNRYPINLSAAVALSGWLPCSRIVRSRVHASQDAARRAASLPVLVCHGLGIYLRINTISSIGLFITANIIVSR